MPEVAVRYFSVLLLSNGYLAMVSIKGCFISCAVLKRLQLSALLMLIFTYSSLGFAACEKGTAYITPTASQFRGAVSAADRGGMLSSVWHESTRPISCEPAGGVSGYRITWSIDSPVGKTTFDGETYDLWPTRHSDVFMMISVAGPDGDFHPLQRSSWIALPSTGHGSVQQSIKFRVRYLSLYSSMAAGLRVFDQSFVLGATLNNCYSGICSPYWTAGSLYVKPFSFNVNGLSCTLDAPPQVKLNSVNLALLSSQGATADGASFQLGVSCNKTYLGYRVLYSMVDVYDPANMSSNLALAKLPDQASGVALQVVDDGHPLSLGLNDNPSLMGTMAAAGGTLKKMLSVRYIRTGAVVTPGKVNAGVSVTLSYE
ncbi:MAG: fimbrial protein [Pseudomonas sp.]